MGMIAMVEDWRKGVKKKFETRIWDPRFEVNFAAQKKHEKGLNCENPPLVLGGQVAPSQPPSPRVVQTLKKISGVTALKFLQNFRVFVNQFSLALNSQELLAK